MMPNPMLELSSRMIRTDRASQDLRDYVRDEWSADGAWWRRAPARPSLWARLRAGWPSAHVAPPVPSASPAEPVPAAALPERPVDCPHPAAEDLGFGGATEFLRCTACGDVLVVQAGRRWRLRSTVATACDEAACP